MTPVPKMHWLNGDPATGRADMIITRDLWERFGHPGSDGYFYDLDGIRWQCGSLDKIGPNQFKLRVRRV